MLKRIPLTQVRLGMYIQKLSGSWIDHPFWRKSFKLDDAAILKELLASDINEVVIDISKGLDVELNEPHQDTSEKEVHSTNTPTPAFSSIKPTVKPVPAGDESARAKKILSDSKQAVTSMFNEVRMGNAINAQDALPIIEEITASIERNGGALISLVRLKNKDDYTYMHSVAVCALMIALGREIKLSEDEIRQAGLAGLLHDIGKAFVPLDVLNKPGKLTDSEFDSVKLHPVAGHSILLQSDGISNIALDVCLHHHEKIDGSGYPKGHTSENISVYAKMGAICDVYDAITSNRPYKEGWEPGESLQRMAQWKAHFDNDLFKAFVKSVGIYPIGSMVKLKSGRLAVVVDQSKSLIKPVVKAFFSIKAKTYIPIEIIDLSSPGCKCEIVGHENPAAWGIYDLTKFWAR